MRRWLIGSVALVLVLVVAFVSLVYPRPSKVTKAAFDRIEEGMTRAQVEALLGGPPGDYRTRPGETTYLTRADYGEVWEGDEVDISVEFDTDVVSSKRFTENSPPPTSVGELILWRFGRVQSRWLR